MHLGWNLISYLVGTRFASYQAQILQKVPFSIFQQCFLWIFFIFSTFENILKILALWVLSWYFLWYCLSTQRIILPIFKSFGVHLSILVVIPYVMPIPLELMYFGAWLGETQVNPSLHVDYTVTFPDSSNSRHTPDTPHFVHSLHSEHTIYSDHSNFHTDNMAQPPPPHERTMSELTASNL